MGVTVQGLIDTEEMLLLLDTTAPKRVVKALVKAGKDLQKLAIKMAPVDEGDLEKAIMLRGDTAGRERNAAGQFTRTEVEVYIDMDKPLTPVANRPSRDGKTVGDYAYEIHEHLSPVGSWNLGPLSNQKQMSSPDVVVGGGFMTRAADQIETGLDGYMLEALAGLL